MNKNDNKKIDVNDNSAKVLDSSKRKQIVSIITLGCGEVKGNMIATKH